MFTKENHIYIYIYSINAILGHRVVRKADGQSLTN